MTEHPSNTGSSGSAENSSAGRDPASRDSGHPPAVPDLEPSYLKLLESLRAASAHGAAEVGVVRRMAEWNTSPRVLAFIALHRPWLDDWEVKEALLRNEQTPDPVRRSLETQVAIFDLLEELDHGRLSPEERGEVREDVRFLIQTLKEHDRKVVRHRAYDLSSSRRSATESAEVLEDAEEERDTAEVEALEATAPEEAPQEDSSLDDTLPAPAPTAPKTTTGWIRLAESPSQVPDIVPLEVLGETPEETFEGTAEAQDLEERCRRAAHSQDPEQLAILARDSQEPVLLALASNPLLPEELGIAMARRASRGVAEAIHRHRRLFMRPGVQKALLDNPQTPVGALLEVVNSVSDLAGLLKLLSSPKVRYLEVKAKARGRLGERFRAMSTGGKVAAVRRHGRSLLRHLWRDFFRDEELVLRCLRGKQLDQGTVHEIARSQVAPRRALEEIGTSAAWTGHYPIRLALVMNPKTPRQVALRLIPKLNPADRRMLKNNPAVPEALRRRAG